MQAILLATVPTRGDVDHFLFTERISRFHFYLLHVLVTELRSLANAPTFVSVHINGANHQDEEQEDSAEKTPHGQAARDPRVRRCFKAVSAVNTFPLHTGFVPCTLR